MLFRSTTVFFVLLLMARILGRKQLSQLTFFHYITGITIGSIAGEIAGKSHTSMLNGLVSIIWWSLLTILINYLGLKFSKVRVITDGEPVIIIKEGKILERELRKLHLNMDDLSMLFREKNIFSINEIYHAVFEPNGKLSIMLKHEFQPLTNKEQHGFTVKPKYMPMELIVDGKVVEKNLREVGITEAWLGNQLKILNLNRENVFYVELQQDGSLYIDKRDDTQKE
ncbi:DUF421 domain-containing protein [Oceanobacillus arenosus]